MMAAQVEVQSAEVGRTGAGGRLHLSPLTDASNKSHIEIPSVHQAHIIDSEPNKPVPGPKPRISPKPFAVDKNPTIKPILAPKPQTKPRPESTHLAGYKPELPCSLKPQQPAATVKVSSNPNRPASTSFKTCSKLNSGQTTKPVVQPFKPAPPFDPGDPSKPTPPVPTQRQRHVASSLGYSKSLKNPPAAEWSGTTKKEDEKDTITPSKSGASITRAKSMGFLAQVGQEEEEIERTEPEVAVPLRPKPRSSRPRPVSAILLDSPSKTEAPVPAPRWGGRRPLSADLTSKFESIGLSLHRKSPMSDTKENTPKEMALAEGREQEKPSKSTTTQSTDVLAKPDISDQSNKKQEEITLIDTDQNKQGVSVKSRISLLLDSPSMPGSGATGQGSDLHSPIQPVPENEPPVGVKQLIKQLTEDTSPAQSPVTKPAPKPRPLPLDLTKRFSSEGSPDLGSVSLSEATDHQEISKAPQRRNEELTPKSSDQRAFVNLKDCQEQLQKASMPEVNETGNDTFSATLKERAPSLEVQTVRASVFENVVERHNVMMVDEAKPVNKPKDSLSNLSFHRRNRENEGSLVTATFKEHVSPPSPLRVLHAFDSVQAITENRAVSESVPSAQWEDKAMTLRSRRSEGSKPLTEKTGSVQPEPNLAVTTEQQPRYLRVGALPKWSIAGHGQEADVEKGMLKESKREGEAAVEKHRHKKVKEEVAISPEHLKMQTEEQQKPRATYFALTGQMQEPVFPVDAGAKAGNVAVTFDDFSVRSALGGSQGKILPYRRNPSLDEAFGKTSQDQVVELMMSNPMSHREIRPDNRDVQTKEEVVISGKGREFKNESEKHRAIMKELEKEKLGQLEIEKQAHLEFARKKDLQMQREFEKQRQKAFEKEKQEFEKKQRALELQKQIELEKQKLQELERDRLRQFEREKLLELQKEKMEELERQQLIELEKQRHREMEREETEKIKKMAMEQETLRLQELAREMERQREMEKEHRKEMEREKQREMEREKQRQIERENQREMERENQRQIEREKQREMEREKQREMEREKQREAEREKQREMQREMEREKQREMQREMEREKQREMQREMEREKQREMEREKQREMQREMEREKQREMQREMEREKQREMQREMERERQREMQREMEREKQREMEREKQREMQREMEREKQREMEREKQRVMEREKQREMERQRQLDIERQDLENQRSRQRELEWEKQKELERLKDMERRQVLEFERQKQAMRDRQQVLEFENCRLAEEMEMEEAEKMRQIAKQQEAERQRIKEKQKKDEQERVRLESSNLRPKVLDLDSVLRNEPISKAASQRSDPATRWKQPSARMEEPYKPAVLNTDAFTSQAQLSPSKDLFPVSGIQGGDAGFGAKLLPTAERDSSWKVPPQTSVGFSNTVWMTSLQDPWELQPVEMSVDKPVAEPRKYSNLSSPEQLLLRQEEKVLAPQRHWSALLDEPLYLAPATGTDARAGNRPAGGNIPAEQVWVPRELQPQNSRGESRSHRRTQGSQELNRMRSRSVSRRSAPSSTAVEGSLSRMRSRSAHREQDRHSWVQQKQGGSGEEEGNSSETPVRETDSQYGTWETGLRTDDSLTPATPSSDSNLTPSPRKPTPPYTTGDHTSQFETDTLDGLLPPSSDSTPLSFPDAPTTLLDTSVFRSRAQLGKKRAPRTRPSRAVRLSATLAEGEEGSTEDWLYRDSTEAKAESKEDDSDSEEQARGADALPAAASQPQRVALFTGVDPSALKAQLKKRGDCDNQTDGPAPSPSHLSRSPKSPFLPQAARVLPLPGGKDNGEEDSPQWLKELKSKKRLSQYETEN